MFTPKEEHKQEMLNAILAPNESYKAKAYITVDKLNWGIYLVVLVVLFTILTLLGLYSPITVGAVAGGSIVFILKAGYVGVTQTHLNVAYMKIFNVSQKDGHDVYRLDLIENLKIQSYINQKVITFKYQGKKVKIRMAKKIASKKLAPQEVDGIISSLEMQAKSV